MPGPGNERHRNHGDSHVANEEFLQRLWADSSLFPSRTPQDEPLGLSKFTSYPHSGDIRDGQLRRLI